MAKKSEPTANDELLEALESIKGLLEKSEGKLSAARESLAKARTTNRPETDKPKIPVSTEPVVPVLDEVVATLAEDAEVIPVLEETVPVPDQSVSDNPPPAASGPAAHSTGQVIDYLNELQGNLEKAVHEGLINALVQIEAEIQAIISEHITRLKDDLRGRE